VAEAENIFSPSLIPKIEELMFAKLSTRLAQGTVLLAGLLSGCAAQKYPIDAMI
jgi:hypothetical protein